MVYSLTGDDTAPEPTSSPTIKGSQSETKSSSYSQHSSLNHDSKSDSNKMDSSSSNVDNGEDASWIELPMPNSAELEEFEDNLDSARKSLQMVESSTQSGHSLDKRSIEMENHLQRLQEDNARLVAILAENNDAMKRNLGSVHSLKSELSSLRESYKSLSESSKQQISELEEKNESLRNRIASMQEEARQKSLDGPIQYYPLDMNHEMTVQDMSSKLIEKDTQIERLKEEISGLRRQLEKATSEQQQPSMCGISSASGFGNLASNQDFELSSEIQELKRMISQLRDENVSLQKLVQEGKNMSNDSEMTYNLTECAGMDDSSRHGRRRHRHKHHRHVHRSEQVRVPSGMFPTGMFLQGLSQAGQAVTQTVRNFADNASNNLACRLNAMNTGAGHN